MFRFSLLCAVVTVGASGPSSGAITNNKIDSGEKMIRTVCVLPLETEWIKSGMKGSEGMTKEADEWTPKMETVVTSVIAKTGAVLVPGMSREQLQANDNLGQIVLQ